MTRIRVALVGLAGAATLLLAACGNGPPPDTSDNSGGGGGSSSAGGGGAVQEVSGQTAAVKISATDDLKFSPTSANAKVGDVVQFTNTGSTTHTVTFDNGPNDSSLNGGDTYEVKITAAGSYHFVCTIHPGMEGTIAAS